VRACARASVRMRIGAAAPFHTSAETRAREWSLPATSSAMVGTSPAVGCSQPDGQTVGQEPAMPRPFQTNSTPDMPESRLQGGAPKSRDRTKLCRHRTVSETASRPGRMGGPMGRYTDGQACRQKDGQTDSQTATAIRAPCQAGIAGLACCTGSGRLMALSKRGLPVWGSLPLACCMRTRLCAGWGSPGHGQTDRQTCSAPGLDPEWGSSGHGQTDRQMDVLSPGLDPEWGSPGHGQTDRQTDRQAGRQTYGRAQPQGSSGQAQQTDREHQNVNDWTWVQKSYPLVVFVFGKGGKGGPQHLSRRGWRARRW
jgi:hypothetical protein